MNEELKIYISAEIADLKKHLKEAQQKVKETADKGESGFKKFGEAAKKAGKVIAGGLKVAGAAIAAAAGALVALGASTKDYRVAQAKLATAFETAGGSARTAEKAYNDLYRVLGDSDVAVEAANHLAKITTNQQELSEWTTICQGVYATFGDSLPIEGLTEAANETAKVGAVTGSLADALNWAGVSEDEFNEKLAACNTEAEREKLIRETLTGLYDEAAANYEKNATAILAENEAQAKLTAALAELGAVVTPIMTTLKVLAADLLTAITPFVSLIGEGLSGALESADGAAEKLSEGISGILQTLLEKARSMLPVAIDLISALVPDIISTVLAALPQLLQTVIDIGYQLIITISEILPSILAKIGELLPQTIIMIINAIPQLLEAATTLFLSIIQAISDILPQLIVALPKIIDAIISSIITAIPLLLDAAIKLFDIILSDALPALIDALIVAAPQIVTSVIDGILTALPLLHDAAIRLFMVIVEKALPLVVNLLLIQAPKLVYSIITAIIGTIPKLLKTAVDLFMKFPEAWLDMVKGFPKYIKNFISDLVSNLKKGVGDMKDMGANMIKGLWEGISDMGGWIGEKIKGFGESVLGGLKSFFGIHSPSRIMRDKVGKYLALGIGEGFVDEMGAVNKEIQDSMKPLTVAKSFNITGNIQAPAPIKTNGGSIDSLENNSGWFNKLATAINGNDEKQIILQVDGKTFAQTSISCINQLTKQTGSLPLVFA